MTENRKMEQPQFTIQRVYLKDGSFEAPETPHIFTGTWEPKVDIELNHRHTELTHPLHEVALKVSVTAKVESKVAFLVEVEMAGLFALQHFTPDQQAHVVGTACLNILYPFVRETVSDWVVRGGFPQLLLAPINFEALYQQRAANPPSVKAATSDAGK